MPTQEQALRAYRERGEYEAAAEQLGIPPGQAYLAATGLPADGGDSFPASEQDRPGALAGSTQHLVYGSAEVRNPVTKPEVLEWIKERVAADIPMQQAARARDAALGEVLDPENTDIMDVLSRQHDQVTALIKQLKTIPGVTKGGSPVHQSRRASIVDMITVALSRHEAAEEEHFWPFIRSVLDDGDGLAATAFEQEQEGKDLLTALGKTPASEQEFDELATRFDKACRTHVAFEDRVLLALQGATTEDDRRAVGKRFLRAHRRARPAAPARSHAPGGSGESSRDGRSGDGPGQGLGRRPSRQTGGPRRPRAAGIEGS